MMITTMKMIQRVLLWGLTVSLLAGCSALTTDEPSAMGSIPPLKTNSAMSCGNEPSYTLKGKTYQVLSSVSGYQEEGTASWYGKELQGFKTAGCETFDMNSFSAAHRSLPLPSFVRITNLENQKTVIVRVNDRGPFETDDLIQLSFAAANALGMSTNKGWETVKVRVEALAQQHTESGQGKLAERARVKAKQTPEQVKVEQAAKATGKSFYVVVNNFAEQNEALEMFVRLTSVGLAKTEMATAMQDGKSMHQVRIGPLYTQDQIDTVKDALENNGLATFRVVEINQ
jgi:rare lipoprotein A